MNFIYNALGCPRIAPMPAVLIAKKCDQGHSRIISFLLLLLETGTVHSNFFYKQITFIFLTHSIVESPQKYFRLRIWELIDATPTNNRSVHPRTTVTISQNTPGCPPRWNPPWRGEGAYRTKRFSPSASTSRARPSDAATFDKD